MDRDGVAEMVAVAVREGDQIAALRLALVLGLPFRNGSTYTRFPPGVSTRKEECPSQVSSVAMGAILNYRERDRSEVE